MNRHHEDEAIGGAHQDHQLRAKAVRDRLELVRFTKPWGGIEKGTIAVVRHTVPHGGFTDDDKQFVIFYDGHDRHVPSSFVEEFRALVTDDMVDRACVAAYGSSWSFVDAEIMRIGLEAAFRP
jgi:hypothetical protein